MIDLKPSRKMDSVLMVETVVAVGEDGAEIVVVVFVDGLGDAAASGANLTLFLDGLLIAETMEGDVMSGVVGAATCLVTIVN
jgi:hypothetical protein